MSKTACVYHAIDLDGWMSAAIVKHWFKLNNQEGTYNIGNVDTKIVEGVLNCEFIKDREATSISFIGYNYGQPIPDLSEYDKVIMCDISFPVEIMQSLIETKVFVDEKASIRYNNFIWLDHHKSAMQSLEEYLPKSYVHPMGIRNTKFAACELTWKYFFPNEEMPEIVRLLGRYDCFGHKFTKEDESRRLTLLQYTKSTTRWMSQEEQDELANLNIKLLEEQEILEFQYGARQCISNYEEAYEYLNWEINKSDYLESRVDDILYSGKTIYQYLCTEAKQSYKNGFELKLERKDINFSSNLNKCIHPTYKFICINKERFNPINFGIDYHRDGYDGCACFHYANGVWNFSLYNDDGKVDCSAIAKQFGGGGHKGAAGFRLNNNEFLRIINK